MHIKYIQYCFKCYVTSLMHRKKQTTFIGKKWNKKNLQKHIKQYKLEKIHTNNESNKWKI
jgi:hypothetical protein